MADESQAVEQDDEQADASGGDSEEGKAEQREEREPAAGESGGDDDEDSASEKAKQKEEETEAAKETMKKVEEDPPTDLEDWPDDAAKYETFGGAEGEHSYHEGPEEEKLGPSSLRHHEDGEVSIAGDKVDDPDQYKGEPIPGGPTDPDASQDLTSQKIREDQGRDLESDSSDGTEASGDGDSGEDGGESESKQESEQSS